MSPDKTNFSATQIPIDRESVIASARAWLGVRWLHQGRNRAGIDCAGLLIKVHEELGLPVEDKEGYRRSPDGLAFLNHIRKQTVLAPEILPGTIGVFRSSVLPCHTGFFAMKNGVLTLIHASATLKKVVEEPYLHDLPRLLVEARDIPGII